jgi:DNA/RNA-binding domain of Phe-tRNA-synthetase-like protein
MIEHALAGAHVDEAVFALRPDYRALLIAVDGIAPGPGDAASEALLEQAQQVAAAALAITPVDQLPHIAAWREAYRAFGAKPQRTRNSAEALLRRGELPRVNRLTDIYNAISVKYQLPVGGEDLAHYVGPPRLFRATGDEPFETVAAGELIVEHPAAGEVVWGDDQGVTCRRWNWRQTPRTALTEHTTTAVFILDALAPMTDQELQSAGDELVAAVGPHVEVAHRWLSP